MVRRLRIGIGLGLAAGLAAFSVSAVSAQEPPRERARMVILDTCVMASSTKDNTFTDFSKACGCAARKSLDELSERSVETIARSGELGFGTASIWRKHMPACENQ